MNKKGKLLSITNIRTFNSQNGQRWAVTFEVEWKFYRKNGDVGTQSLLAERIYESDPGFQIGPMADNGQEYEMQFAFGVRTAPDGRKFSTITMTNCSVQAI